jgi:hypothetical protein
MKKLFSSIVCLAIVTGLMSVAHAAITLQPMSTFGGGDGWLSPTEAGGTLSVSNQVRSMGFDPSTSTLLIPSGANTIQRINGTTGAYQGPTFNNTGVSGGVIGLNTVAATSDGVIYASNLTTNSTNSPFKIYRWTSDGSAPTVAYSGNAGLAGVRVGDNIAVTGADATGLLGFGFGSTSNGFATVTTGPAGVATGVAPITATLPLTAPAVGQFRLGLAFVSPTSVIGTQNSAILANATFSGSSGTLASSLTLPNGGSQRGVGYAVVGGQPLLATIDTGNNAVRLYDATNLASPVLLDTKNLTTSSVSNTNGTAQVVFGTLNGQAVLYALNSNNGIQAFSVVPEPGAGLLALVAGVAACVRRRRK